MNSITIRLILIQVVATIAIILLNSGIAYMFYQLIIVQNWNDIISFNISITDIFYFMFSLYLMRMNMGIPFQQYESETQEDVIEEMKGELSIITDHIIVSATFTILLIIAMYYINL